MEVGRDLFDDRFDTDGRSIVLINNPRTMLEAPFATVSNLRATLSAIGDMIDPDQDVVMVYLTSHGGRDHKLAVEFPPLQLEALAPATLKEILDGAGIKWRIIVVSACYSGGFIEPLKDDYTLILTASATDRTSFGCGSESDATYFGDALFQHGIGRIADARVSKALNLQIEQGCRMLGTLELVRGRLVDRDRGRWRTLVRRVAVMQRDRLLTHQMQSASRTEGGQASTSRPCVAKSAIVSRSRPNAAQAVCATAPSSVRRPHVLPKWS